MLTDEEIERLREWGYICEDPGCTASHVDLETLTEIEFMEEVP